MTGVNDWTGTSVNPRYPETIRMSGVLAAARAIGVKLGG